MRVCGVASLALATLGCALAAAQSGGCGALLKTTAHGHGTGTSVRARNLSGRPIVAYVVTATPVSRGDYTSYSLHGVFTDGDSLHPRQRMDLGKLPSRPAGMVFDVDYLRLADGTTCGAATTQDAQQVRARFE